jgi:hypothetical protein
MAMTNDSSDDTWERSIIPIRLHINALAGAAVVVALFHFKAVGANPPEFYLHLRWLTLAVTALGCYIAFAHNFFGWMFLLGSIAVLYNPSSPFHLSRSTWFYLNIASGVTLVASALFLRPNTDIRWLILLRDTINKSLEIAVAAIVSVFFLHLFIIIALMPIAYGVAGDERLIEDWIHWRDSHLLLVIIGPGSPSEE